MAEQQVAGTGRRPDGTEVREAVQRVFREGLRTGRSAFLPELAVWTAETAADLRARFVDRPDESADTFLVKLRRQLDGAPAETMVLAAELLYVNLAPLVPEQIGIPKKREILSDILSWAGRDYRLPEAEAGQVPLTGFLHGGQGFLNYRWAQFQLLVLVTERLAGLPQAQREAELADPWRFRQECFAIQERIGHRKGRAQIHVLQHLLFPDTFLPIASAAHKQRIRDAFQDRLSAPGENQDRDLLALTQVLAEESGGRVDFYASPWVEQWRPTAQEATQRGWLVRGHDVNGRNVIPAWLEGGYCSVSFPEVTGLTAVRPRKSVIKAVVEAYPDLGAGARGQIISQLHTFLTVMEPGDVVVTVTPESVHVGTVQSAAYDEPADGPDTARRRRVQWATAQRPLLRSQLAEQVQSRLTRPATVYDISAVAAEIAATAGLDEVVQDVLLEADLTRPLEFAPVTGELAEELLMPLDWLRETARQLELDRQIILYGPPGTGKTFLARRLAQHLAGAERTRLVQFHPSYTYEDFFEGFRPVRGECGTVAFDIVPGPFKLLAEQARLDPGNPYVLIIDEINRAHLAKVFGELYFLLEYRDEPITTQYSPETPFDLPRNLFVIGTMNTADRSIALIDAAMRRRFAFRRLAPDRAPVAGLLDRWLDRQGLGHEPARILDALNRRLADPERAIGPSYLMTRRIADPLGLDLVWRSQILPLLEDQLYGSGIDVEQEYGLAALRAEAQQAPAHPDDVAG
ncbi:McrB family protein [Kitasatospora mediocidica]|uniref:McrB family protein n=1 Tax=Kitasatospora mediocidica TaxID=58352 RepID=UPI000A5FED78|nr:AAA family ATPase [Kitasatospora mediocidica]